MFSFPAANRGFAAAITCDERNCVTVGFSRITVAVACDVCNLRLAVFFKTALRLNVIAVVANTFAHCK